MIFESIDLGMQTRVPSVVVFVCLWKTHFPKAEAKDKQKPLRSKASRK